MSIAILGAPLHGGFVPMAASHLHSVQPLLTSAPAVLTAIARAAPIQAMLDPASTVDHVSTTLAFADQAGKLAGTFFQASLLPYVAFLYFLGYEGNKTPRQAFFGFQFLLLFVLSTVFTGIVTKSVYSSSLADVDWLHGGAEALLTTTNLYVASGFRNAMAGEAEPEGGSFRYPAFAVFALVVLFTALGPNIGFEQHSAFFFGLGNLGANPLGSLAAAAEPENALSIPTWAIHFSSVFEWLFAMGMVNSYAKATGNDEWKKLTYGMLPLHASGVAACTYHFFYNSPDVGFLVTLQAGLTLLGNTTVAIAALFIALSNGWTFQGAVDAANPFKDKESAVSESAAANALPGGQPLDITPQDVPSVPLIAGELVLLTVAASYLMKYGETALGVAFDPSAILGAFICFAIPAGVGYRFASLSADPKSA